jgi:ketosteroid isomerase-like protein
MSAETCHAFFDAWNRRDIDAAVDLVADDVHYDDFSFVRPHVGRDEVRALLVHVAERHPDVTFRITDVADGGTTVGTHWEVLYQGRPTGRRGVSFYRFDDEDRLVWALDAADPGPSHRTHDYH